MELATVIQALWATRKDTRLSGCAFLKIQSQNGDYVAVDTIGAGIGDHVLVVFGSAARLSVQMPDIPIDAAIIAIVDN